VMLAVAAVEAQKQKYGVTVTADRKADFSAFKSYSWDAAGYPAMDKAVHQQIVDAVDRELKGLGLEKRTSGPSDLQLRYGAQRRTDTDTHADAPATNLPTYAVGTLVVLLRESGSGKEVYRAGQGEGHHRRSRDGDVCEVPRAHEEVIRASASYLDDLGLSTALRCSG
jgi:uncharacterized protein DUF4136